MSMKKLLTSFLMFTIVVSIFMISGCDESSTKCPVCPASNGPVYWVSVTVTNPQGQPQGGAIVTLVNPPTIEGTYIDTTNNNGIAVIQAPAGQQQVNVTMGTVMQGTLTVTVTASTTTTQTNPQTTGTVQLTQNTTTKKVLVVQASAEQLEDVLRVIGFTRFDSTDIYTLRDQANTDSVALYNYLIQYSLIFSDCDGGSEGSSSYAALSRTYGRYIAQGGKIYGGHYNYYHCERIWPGFYSDNNNAYLSYSSSDSLLVVDQNLKLALGFDVASWSTSIDSRYLGGYEKWSSYPTNAKIYGVIYRSSPSIGVIVENYVGGGKYLWTDYHNQDIKDDPKLVKIVQYFLLSM
jgi:hypothetical protein